MAEKIQIDISKESVYTSIFEVFSTASGLISLCDFFQYRTANAKDSPLSLKLDVVLSDIEKDALFKKLLDAIEVDPDEIIFSSILRNEIKKIRMMGLSDETLEYDRVKGFFHMKNPAKDGRSQHKLDAMFKHIRNSFAHGRIGFENGFLILEDKINELTGRMIVTYDDLEKWKIVIEEYLRLRDKEGE